MPLNSEFQDAITRWQIRPLPGAPLAGNDHTDHRWDDRVLATLRSLGTRLPHVLAGPATALARFEGYPARYEAAWLRAAQGQTRWVDGRGIASCHHVWFQLHEDLIATLGLTRGPGR